MLILTRKYGQSIMIGNDIKVCVLGISPYGQVKLGFKAPDDISVHREEIWHRIKDDQRGKKDASM